MATYNLLRNNKTSGPHTFDQMVELGFKPYDLVWVEGKSAAWRYPGEIAEFKELAPLVEEQPYDRFFKKNNTESAGEQKQATKVMVKTEVAEMNTREDKSSQVTHKKSPVNRSGSKVLVIPPAGFAEENHIIKVIPVGEKNPQKKIIPAQKPTVVKEKEETVPEVQVNYAQSLDDIKEMYKETLQLKKQAFSRKEKTRRLLKKSPVILYILALGVLIALTINVNTGKKIPPPVTNDGSWLKNSVQPAGFTEPENQAAGSTENTKIPVNNIRNKGNDREPEYQDREKTIADKIVTTGNPIRKISDDHNNKANQTEKPETNIPVPSNDDATGTRNKTTGTGTTDKKIADFKSLVFVRANAYKQGTFGGIKDLELVVNNNSGFVLDNVEVELTYMKFSKQPLKTEKIIFSNIAPNGSQTIRIPDSPRGAKVEYKITSVHPAG